MAAFRSLSDVETQQKRLGLEHPSLTDRPERLTPRGERPAWLEAFISGGSGLPDSGSLSARRKRSAYVSHNLRKGFKPFVRLEGEARVAAALPVLVCALELIRRDGWCRVVMLDDTGRWSLCGAIAQAGDAGVACEYAREVLRDILFDWDLSGWNDHPVRTKADVVRLLKRGIKRAGGSVREGGWRVSP